MYEDVLRRMFDKGWPFTKAAYLAEKHYYDFLDFPLDVEVWASVPSWLPGEMPESETGLLVDAIERPERGPLGVMRRQGWPWTKAAYVRALYFPVTLNDDDALASRDAVAALELFVPENLPGSLPEVVEELALADPPPEAVVLAKRIRWPSKRAISVARHNRGCSRDEAAVAIFQDEPAIRRVMKELSYSREDATVGAQSVAGVLVESVMKRHGFDRATAIVELLKVL